MKNRMSKMYSHFLSCLRDRAGSILPITAVALPFLVGMTGVGVDISMWMMERRDLQTAADAAVIAAAWEVANDQDDNTYDSALREATFNGFDISQDGELDLSINNDGENNTVITATLRQKTDVWFSHVITGDSDIYLASAAASAIIEPTGDFCILSLDREADGALTATGSVLVESEGCGMAVNSNSDSALDLSGFVDITIGDVTIVGDYEETGNVQFDYESLEVDAGRTPDPYSDLEAPQDQPCDYNSKQNVNGTGTLQPGVYCGGIDIKGNGNVTLDPGVYIIDGGNFSVSGGGTITGTDVVIILTSSSGTNYGNFDITGGKVLTLDAPETGEEGGEYNGVVMYRDRNAPGGTSMVTGTSALNIQGVVYNPSGHLDFGGNNNTSSSSTDPCTKVIGKTIKLHGNPAFGNNCQGTNVRDIGEYSVRLVL